MKIKNRKTIKKYKPIVFSEILRKWTEKFDYKPSDIFSFFKQLDYVAFITSNDKLLKFGEMNSKTMESNFFFLHLEKHKTILNRFETKI